MSNEDLPNAGEVSADLSRFPTMADRLQQGILNFMFLGRAMVHPQGFSSNPEFAGRIDTRAALLRGREPGRHHRRGAHVGRARLRPLRADRPGPALQPAAHAQHAVPDLRPHPLRQVPGPGRAGAGQLDDPAALGPRRGERLRLPHGARPAAEHAREDRAAARGLRRPPGVQRGHRDRGPHHRRPPAHARARPRPQPRPRAVLRHQADPELPVEGQRADGLRHRAAAAARVHAARPASARRRRRSRTRRPTSGSTRTRSRRPG